MKECSNVPVTIKIRSGWDRSSVNYREIAEAAVSEGASMVTLHPRTRSQGFSGTASWDHIKSLAEYIPVPVIGSGDLFAAEDAKRMIEETGCAAIMLARGTFGNPYLFKQTVSLLRTGQMPDRPQTREKLRTAREHLQLALRYEGKVRGCKEIKKHLCAYIKGFPGSASMRNRIVHSDSPDEMVGIIDETTLTSNIME